jgi:hypothetical protein
VTLAFTSAEYWAEIESLAKQVTEEAREHNRDISDVLHETIDGHSWVIYYHNTWAVCFHSPHRNDFFDDFGAADGVESLEEILGKCAFWALYRDVSEHSDFGAEPEDSEDE